MKSYPVYIFLIALLFTVTGKAQDYYPGTNMFSIRISPIYESWSIKNDINFSEFTNVVSLNYYPSHNTSISFNTKYASTGGELNALNGFSDSQFLLKHNFSKINIIVNAGINIPSGITKLSATQFETLKYIGQDLFQMRTPNFGQGTNLILGTSWLHQISQNFVLGLGLSYQIKSEYQPLSNFNQNYKPSNEFSAAAGFNMKLSQTQELTGDLISTFYGNDKVNGNEVFSSGSRTVLDAVYKQYFAFNSLSVTVLYSIVSEKYFGDKIFADNIISTLESLKLNPNKFYLNANFNQRFTAMFSLGYGIYTSIYEKTASYFSNYTIYGLNLTPNFKVSSTLSIPFLINYSIGSASGKQDLHGFSFRTGVNLLF